MSRRIVLPILAALGAIGAIFVVVWSQKKLPPAPIPYPAPSSPYYSAVYGAGLVEASTENMAIGAPFILPVAKIFVVEGSFVKKGDPLFQLDTRSFVAQKETALQQLQAANIHYEDAKVQFSFYERLQDKNSVSEKDYMAAYYAMQEALAQVDIAKATVAQVEVDIQRATVCAPKDGEVLQVNIHEGEVYPAISYDVTQPYVNLPTALVLLGAVTPLQMRIDIDEEDAWRYQKGAPATAFIRGNANLSFPMKFLRVEPCILPKVSFTGNNIEKIDTRVLQVLYQFEPGNIPVYVGQLLDVFIETTIED